MCACMCGMCACVHGCLRVCVSEIKAIKQKFIVKSNTVQELEQKVKTQSPLLSD